MESVHGSYESSSMRLFNGNVKGDEKQITFPNYFNSKANILKKSRYRWDDEDFIVIPFWVHQKSNIFRFSFCPCGTLFEILNSPKIIWYQEQRRSTDIETAYGKHSSKSNESASIRKHTSHLCYYYYYYYPTKYVEQSGECARTSTYHTWSDRVHVKCCPDFLPISINALASTSTTSIDTPPGVTFVRKQWIACMLDASTGLCVCVYCSAAAIFDKALANSFSMVGIGPMPLRHKQNSNLFRRQVKLFRWIIRKFIYKILMVAIKSLRSSFAHTSDANERSVPESTEHRSVENLFLKFILAHCWAMCVCVCVGYVWCGNKLIRFARTRAIEVPNQCTRSDGAGASRRASINDCLMMWTAYDFIGYTLSKSALIDHWPEVCVPFD